MHYRASVVSPSPAVKARVYQSDRALSLTAEAGHTVVILGYLGEPRARSHPGTGWRLRSRGETFVWHDRRLRGLPAGVDRKRWTIPLLVDGRSAQLTGELERVDRPPAWPWIVVGLPFALVTALCFYVAACPEYERLQWLSA